MITHLLFDLDNTLYSARYGLEKNVSERLENYVSRLLGIGHKESEELHRSLIRDKGYGTTIEWLIKEKGFTGIDDYYAAINPQDEADSLPPDPDLGDFLASIPLPKFILTNSTIVHSGRILEKLGIEEHFTDIFDIRFNNFKGKPHSDAFMRALNAMDAKPSATLFIDDYPEFIAGFLKMGGKGVLLDEFGRHPAFPHDRIANIREIIKFLD